MEREGSGREESQGPKPGIGPEIWSLCSDHARRLYLHVLYKNLQLYKKCNVSGLVCIFHGGLNAGIATLRILSGDKSLFAPHFLHQNLGFLNSYKNLSTYVFSIIF